MALIPISHSSYPSNLHKATGYLKLSLILWVLKIFHCCLGILVVSICFRNFRFMSHWWSLGFPASLAGKESARNAGDPSLIPGSGNSLGERISYPLQYSWASLVAQTVKNLTEKLVTWVRSMSWKDLLQEGIASHSSIIAWRIPMGRGDWWSAVHRVAKSCTWLSD